MNHPFRRDFMESISNLNHSKSPHVTIFVDVKFGLLGRFNPLAVG